MEIWIIAMLLCLVAVIESCLMVAKSVYWYVDAVIAALCAVMVIACSIGMSATAQAQVVDDLAKSGVVVEHQDAGWVVVE